MRPCPKEFNEAHAKDAINISVADMASGKSVPNPGFLAAVNDAFPDRDAKLVVGCLSGEARFQRCSRGCLVKWRAVDGTQRSSHRLTDT